ncbi:hypothetical protein BWR10_12500 [Lacticaseibacillus rhamnosus]|uniref:Uncharacterized protein n=1 Tax=Lacticaseibacillus rhamnosus TaxID=47715 RepID=A0AAX0JYK2_LACRH|nr:hypothetical protein BWR10_12500 [Lacticaseibacillus rhamnosus]
MCVRIWRDGQSSGHHVLGRTSTFAPITRSQGQKLACKDLRRNGQSQGHHVLGRTSTFTPITRSQGQKPACKDLRRNGQSPTITPEAMNSLLRP